MRKSTFGGRVLAAIIVAALATPATAVSTAPLAGVGASS